MNRDLIIGYAFSLLAILGGIVIILFGEISSGIGDGAFRFDDWERLYGLYPIALGSLFLWGFRIKHQDHKENCDKSLKK